MKDGVALLRGLSWTVGTYAGAIVVRFGSNVVLSRLLNPELFGMILIIATVRQGIELSSDIGFAQNTTHNPAGNSPAFFNTIWVMQIVRGIVLCGVLFIFASPIAQLYGVPVVPFEITAATFLVSGFMSTSIFLLHRNMQVAKWNLFEFLQDAFAAIVLVLVAFVSPTINALVLCGLATLCVRVVCSHFLIPERNQFWLSKQYVLEIFKFGRWIFLSSLLTFFCANFDRLYLGKVLPLVVLGVYGIARSLADLPSSMMARVGYQLVFPLISSKMALPVHEMRAQLSSTRRWLLLVSALAIGFGISISDAAVRIVYDHRYHDAAWMLPILLFGVWLAVLCSVNEYSMLGRGKPSYNVMGNGLKLAFYVAMLPLAFEQAGILGVIIAIAASDLVRYLAIAFGQWRERFSFFKQDAAATAIFLAVVIAVSWLRSHAGFGNAFDTVPFGDLGHWFRSGS